MSGIPLSRMLADLRGELIEAQNLGKEHPLKFEIQDIELELQMTTTQEGNGNAGVKFWVFNAEGGLKDSIVGSHTIKLKMKALGPDGENFKASSTATGLPK